MNKNTKKKEVGIKKIDFGYTKEGLATAEKIAKIFVANLNKNAK